MNLFAEFSGVYEGARRRRLHVYRVTWVVRDRRLLWTATIQRSDMPEMLVRGVIVLLGERETTEVLIRTKVHQAIDDESWALPNDLAPLGAA